MTSFIRRVAGIVWVVAAVAASPWPALAQVRPAAKAEYQVTLFDRPEFKGRKLIVRSNTPGLGEALAFNDRTESVRWSLPKDTVCVLCDAAQYEQPVLVLIGTGEIKSLWDYPAANKCITSVAFLPRPKKGGFRPAGVAGAVPVVGDSPEFGLVTLFDTAEFRGRQFPIRGGILRLDDAIDDQTQSIKWQLPKDIVCVLYADPRFEKPLLVLIGVGEIPSFTDKYPDAVKALTGIEFQQKPAQSYRPDGVADAVPVVGKLPDPPAKNKPAGAAK